VVRVLLSHEWLLKFVQHSVADPRILTADPEMVESRGDGGRPKTEIGTPQGGQYYLHYVFDLWVNVWRKKCAQGDVIVVRYADDTEF
jgi:hypothetical protein